MLCCVSAAELDMGWVNPWVGLDWVLFYLIVVHCLHLCETNSLVCFCWYRYTFYVYKRRTLSTTHQARRELSTKLSTRWLLNYTYKVSICIYGTGTVYTLIWHSSTAMRCVKFIVRSPYKLTNSQLCLQSTGHSEGHSQSILCKVCQNIHCKPGAKD